MMPKFGNITNPSEEILKEIKTVASMKFDFVEIGVEGPGATPEIILKNKTKILQLVKKFKSRPIVHTSWWFELGSVYEPVRKGWIDEGKKIIEISRLLGSRLTNFHATVKGMYFKTESGKKLVISKMSKSLRELTKFGKMHGIDIMLENMTPGSVSSIEDYSQIMKNVKDLKLHLDVGHAFIGGGIGHVEKYIRKFKKRLVHIHVSDNHGSDDEHLPLGRASINYKTVARVLKEISYDKTITFEVFTPNRELARKSMEYFRNLWNKV